ncbi:MAG: 2-oxoacid:acceptor oxidoreductase family protein [Bacillota bacterium]|nr:2-oxoacid:acceptor oxidoreductase family protein [Bacillota bacterium]MDD3297710.1 2-oxoacid:acceptor oxidoreductase family protein [Bacillota bacterium]MDD3850395.1 2-oxoacid:acceptor oxidoreductase family protein [Bacillota bacterium]MDD4706590.1 2-oxoacid:acceptor oxidoreductase family protein [Bacillota bacterium]
MNERIVMAGFGGQGVMSMGQLLTYAGMIEGKNVSWLPSYGPEMRGGTANCNVIISDNPVASPIVTDATAVIAMNRPSLDKFEPSIVKNGLLLINSSLIDKSAERDDIVAYDIPANEIADELGNSRIANMVMLGAYLEATGALKKESVLEALKKVFGERKAHLIPVNKDALDRGAELVKGNSCG